MITENFCMENPHTMVIVVWLMHHFHIFVNTFVHISIIKITTSALRHDVAIILPGPRRGTAGFSWNHQTCSLPFNVTNSTSNLNEIGYHLVMDDGIIHH